MPENSRRTLWIATALVIALLVPLARLDGTVGTAARAILILAGLGFGFWLTGVLLRRFLFRVGRRLAFSYFLIGVLPIPMVLLLGLLATSLVAGFFVGHLFRDVAIAVQEELGQAAEAEIAELRDGRRPASPRDGDITFAYYRRGVRFAGDASLPRRWQPWWDPDSAGGRDEDDRAPHSFVALDDGTPTLAVTAGDASLGVLAVCSDSIEQRLADDSGVWVQLLRNDDPNKPSVVRIKFFNNELSFRPITAVDDKSGREAFFATDENTPLWHRPALNWVEISGPLKQLDGGEEVAAYVAVQLSATPSTVARNLLSSSAEFSTLIWGSVIMVTAALSAIYAAAVAMALFLIYALSRAVNTMSVATEAVRAGDFTTRIRVRRRDQIGELQHSFNQMAGNLEQLVATAAENEILEKELSIARDVQQSLLPTDLPSNDTIRFATLFEPSAAIGGDYFDVLPLGDQRFAVVVADVSGHGLPTGLRMAMLKAALGILVEDGTAPLDVFSRLHGLIRSDNGNRYFVTATISEIDPSSGRVEITNAGHPPTYRVRNGIAEEYELPGTPLGTLGGDYGQTALDLLPGDYLVWLSDGLIERVDARGEPFGYQRLREALSIDVATADELRDRLVAAVESYSGAGPAGDDCTLVVMQYSPQADG